MNDGNDQDLKELIERFFGPEQANEAVSDIAEGERILRQYPAPEPDEELIADIKSKAAARLPHGRVSVFRTVARRAVAVAAAIIILAVVSARFFEKGGDPPETFTYVSPIPTALWESSDIAADDTELAVFTAEVRQIEEEILNLQSGQDDRDGEVLVSELEIRFAEIQGDFWKE